MRKITFVGQGQCQNQDQSRALGRGHDPEAGLPGVEGILSIQWRSQLNNWGGQIFMCLCSTLLITFEI